MSRLECRGGLGCAVPLVTYDENVNIPVLGLAVRPLAAARPDGCKSGDGGRLHWRTFQVGAAYPLGIRNDLEKVPAPEKSPIDSDVSIELRILLVCLQNT